MQANNAWDILADEEDDELQLNGYLESLKDVILFAIDCSPSMLAPQPNTSKKSSQATAEGASPMYSHLFATLRGAVALMKKKAMNEPNDMVGILLFNTMEKYGTEQEETALGSHITVFQSIGQVNADVIQKIMTILHSVEAGSSTLEEKFRPWSRRVAMSDVFSGCNVILREQAPNSATKRVFLVTDEDDPHGGSFHLDTTAKNTLRDLYSRGVTLEPFFISTPAKPFKVTKRYIDILSRSTEDDENAVQTIPAVIEGFSRFLEQLAIKEAPKRSQFSTKMTIGNGFTIGVKGYGLVVEQKKGTPKTFLDVDGELKELESKTAYFAEGTLDETIKGPVVYGMSLATVPRTGDDGPDQGAASENVESGVVPYSQVYYTAEDVKSFRTLGLEPGIKILGFKDADTLVFEDNIKHSYFIYPNEAVYKGSIRAFNALLKTLVAKEKIGLALALFRRNSSPYFYAMVPQEEVLDADEVQERPPGFHMIPLPYADDIRAAPVDEALQASDDLVTAASAWIKKLKINKGYMPDAYPNPALNLFNSQLEAIALRDEFDLESFSDTTMPQKDVILQRAGPLVEVWKEVLSEDPNVNVVVVKTSGKRKAEVAVDELEIREHYENGTLAKLNMDKLKAFLRGKSLQTTGKKQDLLDRTSQWLGAN